MKKFYRNLGIIVLSVLTAACTCAAVSACSKKDYGDNGDEGGGVEIPAESVVGKWDEYDGVKLAFLDEEAYNDGEIDESKVVPELNCRLGEKYYMVVDFEIEAPYDNDGGESVTAEVKIQPAEAVAATIQDTNSGNVSEETTDGIREIKATYKIPEKANSVRNMRLVIQIEAKNSGSSGVKLLFKSSGEMQGVKTAEIDKCAMLGYSEKLAYEVVEGTYAVKGKGDSHDYHTVIPSIYNGSYVTAILSGDFDSPTVPESITRVDEGALTKGRYNYEVDGLGYLGNEGNNCVILTAVADKGATSLNISDNTRVIYDSAFSDSNIENAVIPDGVTCIGNSVFGGCSQLTAISIPNSVKYFGENVFKDYSSLQCYEEDGCKYLGNADNKNLVLIGTVDNAADYNISENTKFICGRAFESCGYLRSVTIPDGIISIGNYAFAYCNNLTTVKIPKSVINIDASVFYRCNGLTSISVDEGNSAYTSTEACLLSKDGKTLLIGFKNSKIPDGVTAIGDGAFENCDLTEIAIPNSIVAIGDGAFKGCGKLKSIKLPEKLTKIGDSAFQSCGSLTKINIPDGVTAIGANAFYNCNGLTDIAIPKNTVSIGSCAFYGCSGLKKVVLQNGMAEIGNSAFDGCVGLTSVNIPDSVTKIGSGAFTGCSALKTVTLGDGVTVIGDSAFGGCGSLTALNIPKNVNKIGLNLFYGCNSLSGLTVDRNNYTYMSGGNCLLSKNGKTLFFGCKNSTIPSGVTSISSSAFENCTGLTSVTIPDSVTSIGNYAFNGCIGLKKVTIGKGIGVIGESVFSGCSGITNITIPSNVTIVGKSAFSGCSGLKSITLSSNTKSIGEYAFWNCSGVTSITIPKSVTKIGQEAFGLCKELTTITFNDEKNFWNSMNRYNSFTGLKCTVRCTNGNIEIG